VLPTLVTAGNVLAGVLALSYLMDAWGQPAGSPERQALWVKAAWMVFIGMVCDVLDGRIARLTGAASTFGAELDSLADVVTFGVTPALLAKSVVQDAFQLPSKAVTALVAIYAIGAALRLARYNVESARTSRPGHVTMVFRGLPSPAAAGVVVSLLLLKHDLSKRHGFEWPWLDWAFLVAAPVLGLLMVSRFPYPHLVNRWLTGRRSPLAIVFLAVALVAVFLETEAAAAVLFAGYALSGPVLRLTSVAIGRPRWATDEAEDEEELGPDDDEGELTGADETGA
jgi:CDP-diacylglycerol--serine O-phosphatidyltransferase